MEWFDRWFNSPYWKVLYSHRNDQEAEDFISNLVQHLNIPAGSKVCDAGCGKGRHSHTLAKLGYEVVGVDIAENNITEATNSSTHPELESFLVHDLRQPLPSAPYQAIFSLFTSFGYFETKKEHQHTLQNMIDALEPHGLLIIDFLNVNWVLKHLKPEETMEKDGFSFQIQRALLDGYIVKNISVSQDDQPLGEYQERVAAFHFHDFLAFLGDQVSPSVQLFGSYALEPYHPANSPRLIMIFSKQ